MPYWAYVSNDGSNEIQLIDLTTGEEMARVPVPPGPFGLALTPDGLQLWAPLDIARTVAIIDTHTARLFRKVELPDAKLLDVAIHPSGKTAYVLSGSGVLYALDAVSTELTGLLGLGGEQAERICLTPDGGELWIADEGDGTISVVDTARFEVVRRLSVGESAGDVAFTPEGHLALIPDLRGGHVHLIDRKAGEVVEAIDLQGGMPRAIAVAPGGDLAYVALFETDQVLVLDLADGQAISELEGCFDGPNGLAVTPDGKCAIVVSQISRAVCLIDLQTGIETKTIPFPGLPRRVVIGQAPAFAQAGLGRGGGQR